MGKILSTIARPFKLYNVEARAHKVISKQKPTVAPSYPYAMKDIQRADEEDPGFVEKLKLKDVQLDRYLKDIYVVSHDPVTTIESTKEKKTNRPLPEVRNSSDYPEYGYVEPEATKVPQGKFTLKQAIKFITDHQSQPDMYKAHDIARDYKIDIKVARAASEIVEITTLAEEHNCGGYKHCILLHIASAESNVIKYFSMFDIYLPKKTEMKEEITLLNYYGKCKEIVENFYKSRPKEFTEKSKQMKESTTPTVVKNSDLQKKSSNDT